MSISPYGAPDLPATTVGDIGISATSVFLPHGVYPLKGSTWTVQDMSRTEEKMSTVGIVLAVVFVWVCFLGLLFLLMKETRTVGYVQVTVQGTGFHHATLVPSVGPATLHHVTQTVNWARSLAA